MIKKKVCNQTQKTKFRVSKENRAGQETVNKPLFFIIINIIIILAKFTHEFICFHTPSFPEKNS